LFPLSTYSQRSISGFIRDEATGENLVGAAVLDQRSGAGTASNPFGHYSLQIKTDSVQMIFSYVGYQRASLSFRLRGDTTINIDLKQAVLDEVVVNATRTEDIQQTTSMSKFTIPVEQIKSIPTLFGERDVIKVLQLLPGVQGGSEGNSGLYVRGGGPDQNLILLDGVPIYNASHLYGFFSTFNADAINHIELVKGGFPARYGGRLSSVVDVTMREGNKEHVKGRASIGIISSKVLLEGPIDKNSTFLVSARRSYLNLLKSGIFSKSPGQIANKYFLYDLNGRFNYRVNKNNRIFLSAYNGGDVANSGSGEKFEDEHESYANDQQSAINWGNTLVALRWNHVYGPRLFSNISTTYSKYHFSTSTDIHRILTDKDKGETDERYYKYDYGSGIEDIVAKVDFDYVPAEQHYIRFGSGITHHNFTPGVLAIRTKDEIDSSKFTTTAVSANEAFVYFEDDITINSKLRVNAGIHTAAFFVQGKTYHSVQPRVSARYLLNDKVSLKASYATMNQFVHLLTNAGIGLPTDLWVPSTSLIKPQHSQQFALGAAGTLKNDFEVSWEAYYKDMRNVIEYKDGASYLDLDQDWQKKVEIGRGNSYGTELFIQKKVGKVNGWIGYTLSWTNRQFDNLNNGKWFPYRYDRRHDLKIAGTWHAFKNFELGSVWVYGTGNAVTIPLVSYPAAVNDDFPYYESGFSGAPDRLAGQASTPVYYAASRNNYRTRAYHRMDISATYSIVGPRISHEFNISIYNVYARKNPYYLQFAYDDQGHKVLRQVSLVTIVPSISYSINF
jgi:outer membrane cobalamin receptor